MFTRKWYCHIGIFVTSPQRW